MPKHTTEASPAEQPPIPEPAPMDDASNVSPDMDTNPESTPPMDNTMPPAEPNNDIQMDNPSDGFVGQGKFAQKGTELDNLPLSSTDSKAAEKYLDYIVDKTKEEMDDNPNSGMAGAPMQEWKTFTKKQIQEMHEAGQPVCGELEKEEPQKTTKKIGAVKKPAFESPKQFK